MYQCTMGIVWTQQSPVSPSTQCAAKFQACLILLSQLLESNTEACWFFSSKLSPSVGSTGRTQQVFDQVIVETTKLFCFVIFIAVGSESSKTALQSSKMSKSSSCKDYSLLHWQWYICQWSNLCPCQKLHVFPVFSPIISISLVFMHVQLRDSYIMIQY
jgi:hypothetical protein